jgi:hypothetical protein
MFGRCYTPSNTSYFKYGALGIRVCDRWLKFENFFSDMGHRPSGKSLERTDGSKDYSPENCKWATAREQALNKKSVKLYILNGKSNTLWDWAKELGIPKTTLYRRVVDRKQDFEQVVRELA